MFWKPFFNNFERCKVRKKVAILAFTIFAPERQASFLTSSIIRPAIKWPSGSPFCEFSGEPLLAWIDFEWSDPRFRNISNFAPVNICIRIKSKSDRTYGVKRLWINGRTICQCPSDSELESPLGCFKRLAIPAGVSLYLLYIVFSWRLNKRHAGHSDRPTVYEVLNGRSWSRQQDKIAHMSIAILSEICILTALNYDKGNVRSWHKQTV